MASVSVATPISLGASSPFNSAPSSPARPVSSTHSRKHSRNNSRNPTAPPLPGFIFNPGAAQDQSDVENTDPSNPDPALPKPDMAAPGGLRRTAKPPPLPDFKFNPGAGMAPVPDRTPSPTHPILEEMAQNQQRSARSARPAPLPAFTFNPNHGGLLPSPSPTKIAFDESSLAARQPTGHRRRGSGFVGGGAEGGQLISTSPHKADARPLGPPVTGYPGPRGHTHRRSEAVSISGIETSDLIKERAIRKHLASSGPSTPVDDCAPVLVGPGSSMPRPASLGPGSPKMSPRRRGSASAVRPRVGFSDSVDVIPRPLSIVSSETEGSTSTVRGGNHSLTGSINSIAASPAPRGQILTFTDGRGSPQRRPQTADPASLKSLRNPPGDHSMDVVAAPKRPLSASGSPGSAVLSDSPPNKKKHFWFSHSADVSPTTTPKNGRADLLPSLPPFLPSPASEVVRPKTSPEHTASVKKRKVRTWTGSIFSRKARSRPTKAKPKRCPTPPNLGRFVSDAMDQPRPTVARRPSDQLNEVFDADDTIVVEEAAPVRGDRLSSSLPSSLPAQLHPQANRPPIPAYFNDSTSPIIDIDELLDGTTSSLPGSSAAMRMARLHSSERRVIPDAFGTIHRRAESAPQMPAINRNVFGVHRVGSNASLAEDVFDEEEEDNFLAGQTLGTRPQDETESPEPTTTPSKSPVFRHSFAGHMSGNTREDPVEGLGLNMAQTPVDGVTIIDTEDDQEHATTRSSKSTIEAPMQMQLEADLPKRPASSPMNFSYPTPQFIYASSSEGRTATNSIISSPDAEHLSFEGQARLNRFLSEQNSEAGFRASNDDLPSLTDSISTGIVPRISSSAATRSSVEQRAASLSGTTPPKPTQSWKRSSLASLNRLIPGSANGSKLRLEITPDPVDQETTKKKTNRMSKLILFWRSKEKGGK